MMNSEPRIPDRDEHVDEMKKMVDVVAKLNSAGRIDRLNLMDSQYRLLEAENWLEQQESKP
jgi:hypothetical protein